MTPEQFEKEKKRLRQKRWRKENREHYNDLNKKYSKAYREDAKKWREVVHCGECSKRGTDFCPMRVLPEYDDFCSYGERKTV